MKKYTAKPITVEAIKFDGSYHTTQFLMSYLKDSAKIESRYEYEKSTLRLIILDRFTNRYFEAVSGDYVVRGALGEVFVYRDNLFNEMFSEMADKNDGEN